jgi:signal peptide peptidase SppA
MNSNSPCWAITEFKAREIHANFGNMLADLNTRIEAARGKSEETPSIMAVSGDSAVINVQGIILKRESLWTKYGFATSTLAVERAMNAALDDKDVRSIVLNVDSPGGTVDGMHRLVQAVGKTNKQKPVIGQVDGLAASAGYWPLSQASAIYAGPGDEVGSIGVRLMLYDFSRAFENAGIEAVPIDTGKFKSAGAMGTEITAEQRAYFQSQVDAYFADFLGDVRKGRKLSEKRAAEVGDGRTFIAKQALELGLIDGIQSIEETLKTARRMTGKSNQAAKARARMREIEAAV